MTTSLPTPESPPTFEVLSLSRETLEALAAMGYTHPTPVQRAVFDPAVRGLDLVVQARTGTGKTAAFGLPIIETVVRRNRGQGPGARFSALPASSRCRSTGELERLGSPAQHQAHRHLRRRADGPAGRRARVGRPDRRGHAGPRARPPAARHARRPPSIRMLVLDEADEMLSMGFERELSSILERLPQEPPDAALLGDHPRRHRAHRRERLREPEFITLSGDHIGALEILHYVYFVARRQARGADSHPRGRESRERDHLLQHQGRDRARRRSAPAPRLRRRVAQRRPAAERARAGHGAHARGQAALPGRDRRRGARHRHLAPHARHQLRLSRDRRALRAPHRPHRARGPHGHRDLDHRAQGHRQSVPASTDLQDPPHREAAARARAS